MSTCGLRVTAFDEPFTSGPSTLLPTRRAHRASLAARAMSGLTRVEVRHGKAKHAFDIPSDDADATVGWLMDLVEAASGVMRKHQKLICKGAVLESGRSLASQCAHRDGKATVMLVASAGGGGGAAKKPPTAGEAALMASRAAKAAKRALEADDATQTTAATKRESAAAAAPASSSSSLALRRASWAKTGIAGLRDAGIDALPDDVFALGDRLRVLDAHGNRVATVPRAIASLTTLTRLRLSRNRLRVDRVAWDAVFSLVNVQTLELDRNDLTGTIPPGVANMRALETLALDRNALDALPPDLGRCASLRRLRFAENRVAEIPASLGECRTLEEIDARSNALERIPPELALIGGLRKLAVDGNARLTLEGVPSAALFGSAASALDEFTARGCAVGMEELRESEGWAAYDERRRRRAEKAIEGRVMLGRGHFDEGADAERFRRH